MSQYVALTAKSVWRVILYWSFINVLMDCTDKRYDFYILRIWGVNSLINFYFIFDMNQTFFESILNLLYTTAPISQA